MKNKIIVLLIACLIAFITTVTIKNLYDNQIAQEKQGTPADSSDDAYFNARGGGILSPDFSYSSLKVMGAYFYEWNDELYLIGGTEVASGIYNKRSNSVFVFNPKTREKETRNV